jgi:hypothetical protein
LNEKSSVEFEQVEQWLNLVSPALMRHVAVTTCDIASLTEVSPALRNVALREARMTPDRWLAFNPPRIDPLGLDNGLLIDGRRPR